MHHVLFDLDGTLVDSLDDLATAVGRVLEEHGLRPAGRPEVRRMIGDGAPILLGRAFAARGAPTPEGVLERFRAVYAEVCLRATRPYPGIPELLERLSAAGRPVAVVTNKPTAFAETIVEGLGLAPHVRAVLGPERVTERKPSPAHVREALERIGGTPGSAVMVGDGTTDVISGREAGAVTVAVAWGYRALEDLVSEQPHHAVRTVDELAAILLADGGAA